MARVQWQEAPAERRRRKRERGRARGVDDPRRPVVDGRVDRAARDAGPRLDDDEGLRRRETFVGSDADAESRPSGGGASVYTVGATSAAGGAPVGGGAHRGGGLGHMDGLGDIRLGGPVVAVAQRPGEGGHGQAAVHQRDSLTRVLWAATPAAGIPASVSVERTRRASSAVERVADKSVSAVMVSHSQRPQYGSLP